MGKTTNIYLINHCGLSVAEDEAEFVMVKHNFSILFSIHVFTSSYKKTKKFSCEILKCTKPGESDTEENQRIKGCMDPNIHEKYNIIPKTSPLNYSDTLPPLTKNMQDKNKCCPFKN